MDKQTDKDKIFIEKSPDGKIIVHDPVKKKPYDKTLMDEISALLKSGSYDDKIRALEKIEKSDSSFPAGFIFPIFDILKSDSDVRIQKRAKDVYFALYGRYIKAFDTIFEKDAKYYQKGFKTISGFFINTSNAFQQSQNIANYLTSHIDEPINKLDSSIFRTFQDNIESIVGPVGPSSAEFTNSAIGATGPYVQSVMEGKHPDETLPKALRLSKADVVQGLQEIQNADKDLAFNYPAYQLILSLERFLRYIIHERICIPFESQLEERIDSKILSGWNYRKTLEENNPLLDGKYRLIDYSDFSHIRKILENEENRKLFSDILDIRQFPKVIVKLDELEPIRNKIAHSRALTEREFKKLKMYTEDIVRLFKK